MIMFGKFPPCASCHDYHIDHPLLVIMITTMNNIIIPITMMIIMFCKFHSRASDIIVRINTYDNIAQPWPGGREGRSQETRRTSN